MIYSFSLEMGEEILEYFLISFVLYNVRYCCFFYNKNICLIRLVLLNSFLIFFFIYVCVDSKMSMIELFFFFL